MDLALNNLQRLICHKNLTNQIKFYSANKVPLGSAVFLVIILPRQGIIEVFVLKDRG